MYDIEEKLKVLKYPVYLIIRGNEKGEGIWYDYPSVYRAEIVENYEAALKLFNDAKGVYNGPDYYLNVTAVYYGPTGEYYVKDELQAEEL